ncbi:hypothetical protein ACO0QE_002969 [Hanseniaspora vineae]
MSESVFDIFGNSGSSFMSDNLHDNGFTNDNTEFINNDKDTEKVEGKKRDDDDDDDEEDEDEEEEEDNNPFAGTNHMFASGITQPERLSEVVKTGVPADTEDQKVLAAEPVVSSLSFSDPQTGLLTPNNSNLFSSNHDYNLNSSYYNINSASNNHLSEEPDKNLPVRIVEAGHYRNSLGKHAIGYTINVVNSGNTNVIRRYSEFHSLRDCLAKLMPCIIIPPIPKKHSFFKYFINPINAENDLEIIEKRKRLLQNFLNSCYQNTKIRENIVFIKFLNSEYTWNKIASAPPISILPQNNLLAPPLQQTKPSPLHALLPVPQSVIQDSIPKKDFINKKFVPFLQKYIELVNDLQKITKSMKKGKYMGMSKCLAEFGAYYNAFSLESVVTPKNTGTFFAKKEHVSKTPHHTINKHVGFAEMDAETNELWADELNGTEWSNNISSKNSNERSSLDAQESKKTENDTSAPVPQLEPLRENQSLAPAKNTSSESTVLALDYTQFYPETLYTPSLGPGIEKIGQAFDVEYVSNEVLVHNLTIYVLEPMWEMIETIKDFASVNTFRNLKMSQFFIIEKTIERRNSLLNGLKQVNHMKQEAQNDNDDQNAQNINSSRELPTPNVDQVEQTLLRNANSSRTLAETIEHLKRKKLKQRNMSNTDLLSHQSSKASSSENEDVNSLTGRPNVNGKTASGSEIEKIEKELDRLYDCFELIRKDIDEVDECVNNEINRIMKDFETLWKTKVLTQFARAMKEYCKDSLEAWKLAKTSMESIE